ncbi:hypothetical protein CRUP_011911, partial [Coryphaenoides rupestris]
QRSKVCSRHSRCVLGSCVEMEFVNVKSYVALLYDSFIQNADARTGSWLLMSSPLPQTIIIAAYIFFVTSWGPRLMEHRKAFDLKGFMMAGWGTGYTYRCDLVDYSPSGTRMAATCWLYYFSKFIEMLDTIFFVLRKRNSQVTFLHVYHHSIMPFTWWFGVRFSAGGLGTFHAMLNSVVHIIMYSYYGLTAMGPSYQKYLWWKKYLTTIQLIQFVMVTTHICQYFFLKDCPYQFPVFIYIIRPLRAHLPAAASSTSGTMPTQGQEAPQGAAGPDLGSPLQWRHERQRQPQREGRVKSEERKPCRRGSHLDDCEL